MLPEIAGRFGGRQAFLTAVLTDGRVVFGPFLSGDVLTGLLVTAYSSNLTGTDSPLGVEVAGFAANPADTAADFARGRQLLLPYQPGAIHRLPVAYDFLTMDATGDPWVVNGRVQVELPIRWTATEQERWLAVQFTSLSGVGNWFCHVYPRVGE